MVAKKKEEKEEEEKQPEETKAESKTTETPTKTIGDTLKYIHQKNARIHKEDNKFRTKLASEVPNWKFFSTGVPSFDAIYGGIPMGKYTVIYGGKNSGKTTLAYKIIASAQKLGLRTILYPAENVFDKLYAGINGVDLDNLIIGEDFLLGKTGDEMIELVEGDRIDLIVIDSLTMLLPEEMDKKKAEEDDMALDARRITRILKKMTPYLNLSNTAIVLIAQIRDDIGASSTMRIESFGGGNALKHMASYIIRTRPTPKSYLRAGGQFMTELNLRSYSAVCEKSKSILVREGPHNSTETPFMFFGYAGLDMERTLFEYALGEKIIERSGAKYSFITKEKGKEKEISATGEVNFIELIRNDKSAFNSLADRVWEKRINLVSERTRIPKENILGNIEILK